MKKILKFLTCFIFVYALTFSNKTFADTNTKTFIVTKKDLTTEEKKEEHFKEFDTFFEAIQSIDVNSDPTKIQYIITLTKDYTIPKSENLVQKQNANLIIRSKDNNKFTLKRKGERLILSVWFNSNIKFENLILDGNNETEAFYITGEDDKKAILTIKNCTIQNFKDLEQYDLSSISVRENSILNIENSIIQNNTATTNGAIIYSNSDSTINIKNSTFINNKSDKSAGAIAAYGDIYIDNSVFEKNQSKKTSGAVLASGKATIKNTTFKENLSQSGGAIYANEISIESSKFIQNFAKWGGALFLTKNTNIQNVKFDSNLSLFHGGAIYHSSEETNIINSTFNENKTGKNGGAIFSKGTLNIKITPLL